LGSYYFAVISFSSCSQEKKDNTPWVSLIKGNTLYGWNIKGGNATYDISDGVIAGTTV
tara:strand:- start:2150 stop:2323 length:174 start_codon:yes stop_codon:yes gene_type:complete